MNPTTINTDAGIIASIITVIAGAIAIYEWYKKTHPPKPEPVGGRDNHPRIEPTPSVKPKPIVHIDGVQEFTNKDQSYLQWLQTYPQGFVINTPRAIPANDMVLHRAQCALVKKYKSNTPIGAFTERGYIKICSVNLTLLEKWAKLNGSANGSFSSKCGQCKPAPETGSVSIPVSPVPVAVVPAMGTSAVPAGITPAQFDNVLAKCRALPPAEGNYLLNDYVENLLLTVLDLMLNTPVVVNAQQHYIAHAKDKVRTHQQLKDLLNSKLDTQEGNTQVAQYLWGYNLWTRVGMLRGLVAYFDGIGITTQEQLTVWANQAKFEDFAGKVKGLGFAAFKWLIMRQGVETIKPDIWVHRFVKDAIGHDVSDETAVILLEQAAADLGVKAYELDWRIWENGRSQEPSPASD